MRVPYSKLGKPLLVDDATFQQILVGGLKWANGDAKAPDMSPNLLKVAPGAMTNQPYTPTPAPKAKAPAKKAEAKKK